MRRIGNHGVVGTLLSGFCVVAVLLLLLKTGRYCCPCMEEKLKTLLLGLEDSPVRAAFGTLAEGLERGKPIRTTLIETVEVFFEN